MKITEELIKEINVPRYRIRLLSHIMEQAKMIDVNIINPSSGKIVYIRKVKEVHPSHINYLIDYWDKKYEVKVEPFEFTVGIQYSYNEIVYDYPSSIVEIYKVKQNDR